MTKRIKHVSNLPEWFDLAKYAGAESLNTAGWYEQLSIRRELIQSPFGSIRIESMLAGGPPIPEQEALRLLALIRTTPIVDIAEHDLLTVYSNGGALHELKTRTPRYSFGVRLTTVHEHYLIEHCIEKDKRTHARNYFAQKFGEDNDMTLPVPYQDWIEKPIDGIVNYQRYDINIRVNTLLPDKVLIEQFKQVLNRWRSATQQLGLTIENVRKPNFSDWIHFGVLPYLDLLIWQQETGVNISNRAMANAIFPPGEGGEEVVRKTTAKLADDLLTLKHLETLAAIAAHEIVERKAI